MSGRAFGLAYRSAGIEEVPEEKVETEEQRWLKFFKDGDKLDETALPGWMNTNEMRQAMSTLRLFSEKERDYFAYQARQDFLREQRAIQKEKEEMERERLKKQSMQEELERLRALLAQAGKTP